MNEPPDPFLSQPPQWMNRLQAFFEIFVVSGLVSSFLAAIPFRRSLTSEGFPLGNVYLLCAYVLLEAGITLGLIFLLMRAHAQGFQYLGLRRGPWRREILLGVALVPLLFIINGIISVLFQIYLPAHFTTRNPLLEPIHTRGELALFVFSAVVAGGIKEEVQRAFILMRFRDYLGGAPVGLILWSIVFGAAHYVQGWQGVVAAGLFGFIFGAVYLARRNLIAPMVAHGLYDTVALLGYWFLRASL